jgi:UDP-glucose 4-epimerase
MTTQQKVVAITGSSGHLGTKLLEHLEDIPGMGKLVGFDNKPLHTPVHNIAAYRKDVRGSMVEELSRHRVTTLVHLAIEWKNGLRRREAAEMSERNVNMVSQVIESSIASRVRHLIYVSSHAVYGARPELPIPVSEEWPANPASGFTYAQGNLNTERALLELAENSPDTKVTILRSCPALGVLTSLGLLRELYFPGWVGISDHNPPLQFVSDDDLARILCLVIRDELPGVFNVAADGVIFLRELAKHLSTRQILMPATLVQPLKQLTGGGFVAYHHNLDRWPVVMSTAKLKRVTGYHFRRTALDAVASFISYNNEFQESLPRLSAVR